jgi:hypothetical protein
MRDFRNAVAALLVSEVPGLDADDVIVERSNSLSEQIATTVSQASNGIAVTIGPGTGRNVDPQGGDLNMDVSYEITLWVKPIYFEGTFPEDDLFIPMMRALHGNQVIQTGWCHHECRVESFRDRPDPDYLAMTFTLTRRLNF